MIFFLGICTNAIASTDLIQVFQQAVVCDPAYQQTIAQTLASKEAVGISAAQLLPNLSFTAQPKQDSASASGSVIHGFLPPNNLIRKYEMKLKLTQTIFNYAKFANLVATKASARQAAASLNAAFQNLILRVAQAYLNVLQDEDNLQYCRANQDALEQLYYKTKKQFEAGASTKTDIYSAQSAYGSAKTTCLANEIQLANDKEFLRTITNSSYQSLAKLKKDIPLVLPQPADMEAWVCIAQRQNWTIRANQFALQNARENIRQQFAGHYPVLDFEGYYDTLDQQSARGGTLVSAGSSKTWDKVYSLNLSVPIFSGGSVVSATNQARYYFQVAEKQLEASIRNSIYTARQSYLSLTLNISKIQNDAVTIKSSVSALEGTSKRFKSGGATILDVLNQREKVVQSQSQYAADRYSYIMSLLTLKNAAGTLCVEDLEIINSWLDHTA